MNRPRPYQIPRDCALPSLKELLRIDAEEEARMAQAAGDQRKQQERQSTVERLRKAIERRGSSR